MARNTRRVAPREGYDRWSRTYDDTKSALIALDRRETPARLALHPGARVLDAGCGTGAHLASIESAGGWGVGLDLSAGMLGVARRRDRARPLVQADLNRTFPVAAGSFDTVLSSLVSEHLGDIGHFFDEVYRVLRPGGRVVLSAFHPDAALAGLEANFETDGVEYRLGAEVYSVEDYLGGAAAAGLEAIQWREFAVDASLGLAVPAAADRIGEKLLLLIVARKPSKRGRVET